MLPEAIEEAQEIAQNEPIEKGNVVMHPDYPFELNVKLVKSNGVMVLPIGVKDAQEFFLPRDGLFDPRIADSIDAGITMTASMEEYMQSCLANLG